jgi:hypothetical protein
MLMAASAPQGFGVGLSLADAMRTSLWAISWAMFASTRAGLATTTAYASALADCRSVEELASLQAHAAQDTLRAAEACASEMAEATGRLLNDAEAAIKGTDAATADPAA